MEYPRGSSTRPSIIPPGEHGKGPYVVGPMPRIARLVALAAALIALAANLRTLHPGVGPSLDSIELQIAALTGGVIHPPGSPQYLMLGNLAMRLLPGPTPAARLNLMSALFGAAAVGLVALIGYRLTRHEWASLFAALLLAFAPRLWYQSSIAELYALNAFYVALVLYLMLTWLQTELRSVLWWAIGLYALSFGNHLSMILLLPAFLYLLWYSSYEVLTARNIALITLLVALGAAQYAYVPLRAAAQPPFCNYCPGVISPLGAYLRGPLLDYVTGGPFKGQMFALPWPEVQARLPGALAVLLRQFRPWGLALAVPGALGLLRAWQPHFAHRAVAARALLLTAALQTLFVLTYAIPDWHDFMTPVYVALAPFVAVGAAAFVTWVSGAVERPRPALALTALAGVLILVVQFTTYLPVVDQSHDVGYRRDGRALLRDAESGAWLIVARPASPAFYFAWAVQYLSLAEADLPPITSVMPPEVDPPPGPEPFYRRWTDVAGRLGDAPQLLVLDAADDRFEGWGLLPVCAPGAEWPAGYEVVAMVENGEARPLVDAARWRAIRSRVTYERANLPCD